MNQYTKADLLPVYGRITVKLVTAMPSQSVMSTKMSSSEETIDVVKASAAAGLASCRLLFSVVCY